jgi:ornithine cyclodeaminase
VRILDLPEIRAALDYREIIDRMRDALIAQSAGECETPMPMHLSVPGESAEVHIKSSYRRGGDFFALKIAGTFPGNLARGRSTSSGMMLLSSAETGDPVVFLADEGHLTDVRTAAVSAMVARELGRRDTVLGILGTGVQARLQARMHAEVLPLECIVIWGRTPERTAECARELAGICEVSIAASPAAVAREARLIVTATAARLPLLQLAEIHPGTCISAVGSDSPGKQELDPEILRAASLLLVDSAAQCAKLGELQHAPDQLAHAVEIGVFCSAGRPDCGGPPAIAVADFTGLGVEDLYIAEYAYRRSLA